MEELGVVLICFWGFVNCLNDIREGVYNVSKDTRIKEGVFKTLPDMLSKRECAMACLAAYNCWTANYNHITHDCEYSSSNSRIQPTVYALDWVHLHRNDECNDNWSPGINSCYLVVNKSLNWTMAESYCMGYNSHLIEINDEKENDFLIIWLTDGSPKDKYYWTGGRGYGDKVVWTSTRDRLIFTKWYKNEKSPPGPNYDNICIEMTELSSFSWRYTLCNQEIPFICEKQKNY